MVPPASDRISRVPSYSGYRWIGLACRYGDFTLCVCAFHHIPVRLSSRIAVLQPRVATVWALSLSLAATRKITIVFFSSGYLDVSVHRVSLHYWMTGY